MEARSSPASGASIKVIAAPLAKAAAPAAPEKKKAKAAHNDDPS